MTPTSLAVTVAPRTGKTIQNGPRVFEIGENLLQNGIIVALNSKKYMVYYTLHLS